MDSIDLLRDNLRRSTELLLAHIEDMAAHAFVAPTPRGGGHTLWLLGHLAYIEGLVIARFMQGQDNPLAHREALFDGDEVSSDPADYPPFDEVLASCRAQREATRRLLDTLGEAELDRPAAAAPDGHDDDFGTWRRCLQFVAEHWLMHRGQLADARRAAGLERMWL